MRKTQDLKIVLISVINYLYVLFINLLIMYLDDKYLAGFYTNIKNDDSYIEDIDDLTNDLLSNNFALNEQNQAIIKLCNINKTISRYTKKKLPNTYEKMVTKAFLFNYCNNAITDNYQFTNKLVMINNVYESMNTKVIRNLTAYRYKYIYILYRTKNNKYKVKIIDMSINYDIIDNTMVLFNSINLN